MNRETGYVFWVMRCGETAWDQDGRIRGITDLPLTRSGLSAVQADVPQLVGHPIVTVFHPSDEAAQETAQVIAEATRAKRRVVDDLSDPDLGLLEGMTEQMFAERYSKRFKSWREDPLSLSPPKGEDLDTARGRLFLAIVQHLRKAKGEVVFVLHRLGLGMLRSWLADQPPSAMWRLIEERPRVERYALTDEVFAQLEATADEAMSNL